MAASVQSSIVRNVPSFALSTLVQPAVYVSLPMFIVLQAVFFFGAKRLWPDAFKTTAQTSWILTTMSSLVMTLASVPFLIDYFVHNTDLSAIELINAPSSVICSMYFVSYLIMDLALGNKYYPDQIDLITGWLHHLIYPFFIVGVIVYQIPGAFLVASIMELPTIVLAIGHMNRSFRSEYLFGFLFFVTRLLFHTFFAWRTWVVWSDHPFTMLLALGTFPLHIHWFNRWVQRQIRIYRKGRELARAHADAENHADGAARGADDDEEGDLATESTALIPGGYDSMEESVIDVVNDRFERHNVVPLPRRNSTAAAAAAAVPVAGSALGGRSSDISGSVSGQSRLSSSHHHHHSQVEFVPEYRDARLSVHAGDHHAVAHRPSDTTIGESIAHSFSTTHRSTSRCSFVVASPTRDGVDPADLLAEVDADDVAMPPPALLLRRPSANGSEASRPPLPR